MKKTLNFIGLTFLSAVVFLCCFIYIPNTKTFAETQKAEKIITYASDGSKQITFKNLNNLTKQIRLLRTAELCDDFLRYIGFDENQINNMTQNEKISYLNVKDVKIEEKEFYETPASSNEIALMSSDETNTQSSRVTYRTIITKDGTKDSQGRTKFKVSSSAVWETPYPSTRMNDIISIAWKGNREGVSNILIGDTNVFYSTNLRVVDGDYDNTVQIIERLNQDNRKVTIAEPKITSGNGIFVEGYATNYLLHGDKNNGMNFSSYYDHSLYQNVDLYSFDNFNIYSCYGHRIVVLGETVLKYNFKKNTLSAAISFSAGTDKFPLNPLLAQI